MGLTASVRSGAPAMYREFSILPSVCVVSDGEPFAGTWVVTRCAIGRPIPGGYVVRHLMSDNTHHFTRERAIEAAIVDAIGTIDAGGFTGLHLHSSAPSTSRMR